MTREVTDNLYIELGYFTPEEYYTYEANAAAQLNTSASIACDGDAIRDFAVAISSAVTFECTADGGAVKDFTVALTSTASQTTAAVKIVDAVVPFGSAFNSTMTVSALRITDVTLVSEAFFVTDFVVNRSATVALANIANLNSQNDRLRDFATSVSAAASISAQTNVIKSSAITLSTAFTQTTVANKTADFLFARSASFTQTTDAQRVTRRGVTFNTGQSGQLTTLISKFGTGSLTNTGNNLSPPTVLTSTAPHLQRDISTFNWTLDFWRYQTQYTGPAYTNILTLAPTGLNLRFDYDYDSGTNYYFRVLTTGASVSGTLSGLVYFPINQWNHIRISQEVQSSQTVHITVWINGTRIIQHSTFNHTNSSTTSIRFAVDSSNVANRFFYDEIRLIEEILTPRTQTTFTPPTQSFINDNNTQFLLHFDGTLIDDNISVIRQTSATLTTQTTQTTVFDRIRSSLVILPVVVTQTTVAQKAVLNSAQLNTAFTQSTIGGNIKTFVANLPTIASQLTAAGKVGNVLVNMPVTVTQSTQARKITANVSTQTSAFTQTADFARFREGDFAGADAVATITVDAVKTAIFDSTQHSEFTQVVSIDRTRATLVNLNTASTQTVDADVVRDIGLLNFNSQSTMSVDADAVRNANILMETLAINLTAAGYIGDIIANMNTQATMTVDADSTSGAVAPLNAEFTASATALRIKPLAATINSNSNLAVNADVVTVGASTQQAAFTQSTDIARIRGFVVPANSQITQTTVAAKTTTNTVITHSEFTQTVDGDKVATGLSLEPVISNLTASAVVVRSAQSQQNSQATLLAQGEVGNIGEASLTSAFTLTATPAKTAQFIFFEPVTAQVSALGTVIRSNSSQQSVIVTATTSANRLRSSLVSITAFYSQLTVGSEVNSAQAQLNSTFTLTVDAKLIVLDPELTYRVPKETRSYKIVKEIRSYKIIKELRTHEIADN